MVPLTNSGSQIWTSGIISGIIYTMYSPNNTYVDMPSGSTNSLHVTRFLVPARSVTVHEPGTGALFRLMLVQDCPVEPSDAVTLTHTR